MARRAPEVIAGGESVSAPPVRCMKGSQAMNADARSIRRVRGAGSESGAAALEFALVVPILLLLVMGIIEFGFMFQAQLALTHAAREGARLASVDQFDAAQVVNQAFPVTPAIATSPSPPSAAASGDPISVTLTYAYEWQVLPFPGAVTLTGTAVMRKE